MEDIVGIRFVEAGPIDYCRPGDLDLGVGDYVVVTTDRGERLGWVVLAPDQVLVSEHEGPQRVIDRLAREEDVASWREMKKRAQEDAARAQDLAARNDPRMRVASIEYDLAGTKCELTFSAPERVEHRWFGEQCGELFGADVRVRQVGDRDRAKASGDVGVCGLALCCSSWMTSFPTISVRMAKDQDLSPNPSKISGVCGRLLCCLSFEVEEYRRLRGSLPKVGQRVTTPMGRAKVISLNTLKQQIRLRFDETNEVIEMHVDELREQYGTAVRPEELEDTVEAAVREQDQERQRTLVAQLMPVDHASSARSGARPEAAPPKPTDGADSADRTEDGAEQPRRRRRRGRRGGRRRRGAGSGGSDGSGGSSGGDTG